MGGEKRDPVVRLVTLMVTATLFWFVSLAIASLTLNREPASALLRASMVALAMAGLLGWLYATAQAIRAQDEFTQRIHLIAMSCAFAATAVFAFAVDFLQRAGFVGYHSFTTIWLVMIAVWWISMVITSRVYR
jgi:hypothetical protein